MNLDCFYIEGDHIVPLQGTTSHPIVVAAFIREWAHPSSFIM